MNRSAAPPSRQFRREVPLVSALVLLISFAIIGCGPSAVAQVTAQPAPAPGSNPPAHARPAQATGASVASPARPAEEGVRWQKLKPAQREALKPLQQEWSSIDARRKQKWVGLADRMPAMQPDERVRVQGRMAEWAKLTPIERGQARQRFQEAKQTPASDRLTRWQAYQALPPEQKSELAARAAAARASASGNADGSGRRPGVPRTDHNDKNDKPGRDLPQVKSNIVPNPAFASPARPIGPTVLQASPGATTTLITRRPSPPAHQQAGLPKITATPEFVDKSTLLPQRGAQGAAIGAVPSAGVASTPAH